MRKPSAQTLVTLERFLQLPRDEWTYGYELSKDTQLNSGVLYPILIRLRERELVESEWEAPKTAGGGAPRHMYRLTAKGREYAASALRQHLHDQLNSRKPSRLVNA
jgi:PadR family transcriptional regulator, regulatory protein PadR